MNWKLLLFSAILVLLYVPLTLIGANTFFPEYSSYDSGCYMKYPYPAVREGDAAAQTEAVRLDKERADCENAYQDAKNSYNAQKYVAIMLVNVLVLLLVLFLRMNESIKYGLFFGVVVSSFFAIMTYQETKSKIGFAIILLVFVLCLVFINRQKDLFISEFGGSAAGSSAKPARESGKGRK